MLQESGWRSVCTKITDFFEIKDDGMDGCIADVLDSVFERFTDFPCVGHVVEHGSGTVRPGVEVDTSSVKIPDMREMRVHKQLLTLPQKSLEDLDL